MGGNPVTNASIAKFVSLQQTEVAEQYDVPWEALLDSMSKQPRGDFQGWDVHGGWSPVVFDPPKRLLANVKQVFALVLDYDKGSTWEAVHNLWASSYGLVYTTKSHGVEGDRLRAILPLERAVSAAEYSRLWAWAARVSEKGGCIADKAAKDASRFWYDPSVPPGGWQAVKLTGAPINPNAILALEPEPEQPRLRVVRPTRPPDSDQRVRRARAYLAKLPGGEQGSYGHTAMFNAVATVMIGFDLDDATTRQLIDDEYNPRCSPPFSDKEIDHKIRNCRERCKRPAGYLLVDRPRIESTKQAADAAPPLNDKVNVDWTSLLLYKADRSIRRTYHNTYVFVRHHPEMRGLWALDTMTQTPWFDGAPIKESFVHDLRSRIEQRMGYTPSVQDVEAAIATAASDRPFHPIQQYLRSVDWDGEPRLQAMAADYLGSPSPLHAQLVRRWMISAVARALNPGCKVDTALMLYGPQGYFKSTFFNILGGDWHSDSTIDISNKDSYAQIHASWIYEFAELENVVHGRSESRLKAWLTSAHDMYRAPYARTVTRRPRSCVICGSTNKQQFLTDETGSRRFWIIPVSQPVPRELLAKMRDQLWAEAVCAYDAGEPWWLTREEDTALEAQNADYEEDDAWAAPIKEFVSTTTRARLTITELLEAAIKLEPARQDRAAQSRAGRILHTLKGWRKRREPHGDRIWFYERAS